MSELIETLRALVDSQIAFLRNNEFAAGTLFTGVIATFAVALRSYPAKLARWVVGRFLYSVDIRSSDDAFDWISQWIDAHPYSRHARRVNVRTQEHRGGGRRAVSMEASTNGTARGSRKREILFTPAVGQHLFWYGGRLIWLERTEKEQTGSNGGSWSWPIETYTIRTLGRSQEVIRRLLQEAQDCAVKDEDEVGVFVPRYEGWTRLDSRQARSLDSVILPGKERVVADVRRFFSEKDRYRELGIPWRRGYLLYGLPGTGKTSLISALAGELGVDLYLLNLGNPALSDEMLTHLFLMVTPGSLVLMEDLDAVAPTREGHETGDKLTITGLLNALDGVASKDGLVTFMTTNHRERLDPALVRPGRVGMEMEFTYATTEQRAELYQHFFPEANEAEAWIFALAWTQPVTMATVQGHLMSHWDSAEDARRSVPEIPYRAEEAS